MDDVKVSLVEASQILPSFDKRLQRFAEKRIQQREKMELLRAAVTGDSRHVTLYLLFDVLYIFLDVRPKEIVLSDGSVVPCGLTVWAAGISARCACTDGIYLLINNIYLLGLLLFLSTYRKRSKVKCVIHAYVNGSERSIHIFPRSWSTTTCV